MPRWCTLQGTMLASLPWEPGLFRSVTGAKPDSVWHTLFLVPWILVAIIILASLVFLKNCRAIIFVAHKGLPIRGENCIVVFQEFAKFYLMQILFHHVRLWENGMICCSPNLCLKYKAIFLIRGTFLKKNVKFNNVWLLHTHSWYFAMDLCMTEVWYVWKWGFETIFVTKMHRMNLH